MNGRSFKAPSEAQEQEKSFQEIDSDADKMITREEMAKYIMKLQALKGKDGSNDPEQTLKDRQELVSEIFKSKGLIYIRFYYVML